MASIFDNKGEKPSMVADIMSGGKTMLKGAASNITGALDFLSIAPQFAYRSTLGGDDAKTALRKSNQGMLTTAAGLQAPAENTPEYFLYKAGQVLTPTKAPTGVLRYGADVAANAALDTAFQAMEGNEAATGLLGAGVLGAAALGTKGRNYAISKFGSAEDVQRAKAAGLTVGQQTGNAKALRTEEALAASEKADDVRDFYTKQSDSFGKFVERTSKINPVEANGDKAVKSAFEKIKATYKARQTALSTKFGEDLDKFYSKTGGGNRKFIPSDPMVTQIDDLIAREKASVGSTGNETVIKELEKIRKQLTDEAGNPRKISGKEFKEQQSYWSQASASTGSWLDGVAADRAKPMAAKMASAMDETFDTAVNSPSVALKNPSAVRALEDFKKARADYRAAKEDMEYWAANPVNRYFDVENINELKGQEIIDKMANLPPESRRAAIEYLNYIQPELVGNIRMKMADDLVSSGVVTGAAEGAAKFDQQAFLKAVDEGMLKDKLMMDVMFPDAKQQAEFSKRVEEARKMVRSGTAPQIAGSSPTAKATEDFASLAGGIKGRVLTRGVSSALEGAVKSTVIGEDALFKMLFKGEDIRGKFRDNYVARLGLKASGQEQTREATRFNEEELQKLYQQYQEKKQNQGSGAPAVEDTTEPSPMPPETMPAPNPMQAPMEAPQPSVDPSTMSEEQLQQMYQKYLQDTGKKQEEGSTQRLRIEIPL